MNRKPPLLAAALLIFTVAIASQPETPSVTIENHKLNLKTGDTADMIAVYVNDMGEEVDTIFTWEVMPDSLGELDSLLAFTAMKPGEGYIKATLGVLSDSIEVTIRDPYAEPCDENLPYLSVVPGDTVVAVGSQVQFTAWAHDSLGEYIDAGEVSWSLIGAEIGTLSETGLLDVTGTGFAFVQAENDSGFGNTLVIAEQVVDTTGANTIVITRDNPGPLGYCVMDTLREGESWTIGGLPHPLNILNGGMLYFPQGSLHEDIRLHISLPDFAQIQGDSVDFGFGIVSGLAFHVMIEDTIVSPYTFDDPLFVALIFKRGLVRQYGIDPENLTLSYVEIEGDTVSFDDTGIENVVVDSVRNRVYSNVAHFSDLAIHESTSGVVSVGGGAVALPAEFSLSAAYPNPFNPTTSVVVKLGQNELLHLAVSDILGREVMVLADQQVTAGTHRFVLDGHSLASGVYFIRASVPNRVSLVRKAVLLK